MKKLEISKEFALEPENFGEMTNSVAIAMAHHLNREKPKTYGFSIILIIMVLSLIVSAIRMWMECKRSRQELSVIKKSKLTFLEKRVIIYLTRRHTNLNSADVVNAFNYILGVLSEEELDKLLKEHMVF